MKFAALLTGLVLALPSVLAAALPETGNPSGLMIRSDSPNTVYGRSDDGSAFSKDLLYAIDKPTLDDFITNAKTLAINDFTWNLVNTAGAHWDQVNWVIGRSNSKGWRPSDASVVVRGPSIGWEVEYPGDNEIYLLTAFGPGTLEVPINDNGFLAAWRGDHPTEAIEGDTRVITFT